MPSWPSASLLRIGARSPTPAPYRNSSSTSAASPNLIDQESLGGVSEPGDHFGAAVAYAGPAGRPSWIIGVPDDTTKPAGLVYVDYTYLQPRPPVPTLQTWTPGQAPIPAGGSNFGASTGGTVS